MKVLVVIDMQEDFINGALGTKEARAIVPNVAARIQKARDDGEKVIFTRDTHYADLYAGSVEGQHLPVPHCIDGTKGWEICPTIQELIEFGDMVIDKEGFGAYDLPEFITDLDEGDPITQITLVGLCTDICVIANAIVLKSFFVAPTLPVEINVDASCCAGVTPQSHTRALEAMEVLHINVLNKEG